MFFRQLLHEERGCASYVVGCPSHKVAAVADPQGDPERYVDLAARNDLRIVSVFDTHLHADHYSGAFELAAATGATLRLGGAACVCYEFLPLWDGEEVKVGNRNIRVIHTPGHTPEHVSLFVDDWFVLTGDALFVGDVGRVDLTEVEGEAGVRAGAADLHASLQRLLQLSDDVEIYPSHYAGSKCGRGMDGKTISTIGRERRTNPTLMLDLDDFVDFQLENVPPLPDDFHTIKRANAGIESASSVGRAF